MAILVSNYHQSLEQAWGTTLREFFLIADFKTEVRRRNTRRGYDMERLQGLEQHIKSLES